MKKAIIIFTRVPIPGKTKTRMMPTLTPDQCEHLHTCFLKDIRRVCEQCAADIYVCYTPDEEKYKRQIMDILGTEKTISLKREMTWEIECAMHLKRC